MSRREQKKAEKRERIEKTALDLFLEQGFDRASIEQVISGADIARGTFYLYYPDKLSLFQAIQNRWLQPTIAFMDQVHEQLLSAKTSEECIAIYQSMAQNLTFIGISHVSEILLGLRELRSNHDAGRWMREQELELQHLTTNLTEVATERGLVDAENPRLSSLLIMGAVERIVFETLIGTPLGDPIKLASDATILLSRVLGIGPK